MDLRHTTTARLDLEAISPGDLVELHALHADPAAWGHFPAGRHTSVEQTEALITGMSAGELGTAALRAARCVDPQRPVLASMLAADPASVRLAQRLGMRRVHRGPDRDNPDPHAVRLVFADQTLGEDQRARPTGAH